MIEGSGEGSREGSRPRRRIAFVATLLAIAIGALVLRVVPPWSKIFRDGRVVFAEVDPWFHMRQVDGLVAHFPLPSFFDPYRLYPGGQGVEAPLFDVAIAGVAWIAGLGSPSAHLVDVVGAWAPAVLGALCVVPLAALAVALFGELGAVVGLLAAALLAALPGPFLQRSLLGYTDHHVAEVLLALAVLLFLSRALEQPESPAAPVGWRARLPRALAGVDANAVLAGIALALYLLTWTRGAMLILVLLGWATLQLFVDLWHGRVPIALRRALLPCFAVALPACLALAPVIPALWLDVALLAAGICALGFSSTLASRVVERSRASRLTRALLVLVLLLGGAALLLWLSPAGNEVRSLAGRFGAGPGSGTVGEAQPYLARGAMLALRSVWSDFTTSGILGLLGLVTLAAQAVREGSPAKTLFATWSVAMLGATLVQVRFGYYLTAAVALLSAWFVVRYFAAGLQRAFAVVVVLALALYPNLPRMIGVASQPAPGPSADWLEALDWMRTHTPEPFGDATAYLARVARPSTGAPFRYPPSAYGVLCWWDHGYWVTRVARRIPTANPTQAGAREVAAVLTAQSEEEAARGMERLGARYAIVDKTVTLLPIANSVGFAGALPAILRWAERPDSDAFGIYRAADAAGVLRPQIFYYPGYYRTLGVRMLAFGGQAEPAALPAWTIEVDPSTAGEPLPVVRASHAFATLAEAEAHVAAAPATRRLVGWNPFLPCVPIEALTHFVRVHRSPGELFHDDGHAVPEVAIFEYQPRGQEPHPGEQLSAAERDR